MKTYRHLYTEICNYNNIFHAYLNARKRKTLKKYVIEFEKELGKNLLQIQKELITETYNPKPLEIFIVRDPKTRKISKSDFRDRIVHHAIYNIIQPFLEDKFIYDSYANRKNKGTMAAIKRFEYFIRKVSHNNTKQKDERNIKGFALKADIRKFFDSVNHKILLDILGKTIKDNKTIKLIRIILENHETPHAGKGMPLGNLTSQFFANVYLNELDQYIKHELKAKYYIRYVDDFIIMHHSKEVLELYKKSIKEFLKNKLDVELHPEKSKIISLYKGVSFLGLRIYTHHKLLNKRNIRKFKKKMRKLCIEYDQQKIDYDKVYDTIEGWIAYSKQAQTYNLRENLLEPINKKFSGETSTKEYNRCLKTKKS